MTRWTEIQQIAGQTTTMITGSRLRKLGMSSRWIGDQVDNGLLDRVAHNLYDVRPDGLPLTDDKRRRAALLHAPDEALVDRHCAAVKHDLWDRPPAGIVHVATPQFTREMQQFGVSYRRIDRDRLTAHGMEIDGMPCTDMICTCLDFGAVANPWQCAKVIDRACRWHKLDRQLLKAHAAERRTGRGMAATRLGIRLVEARSRGTQSKSEDLAIDLLVGRIKHPLLVCVRGVPGFPDYEPDFVDPVTRRILEVDGDFHRDEDQAERDRLRDAELLERGWPVLRIESIDLWCHRRAAQFAMLEFLNAEGELRLVDVDPVHGAAWALHQRHMLAQRRRRH